MNNLVKTGATTEAESFKRRALILSRPIALLVRSRLRSFRTSASSIACNEKAFSQFDSVYDDEFSGAYFKLDFILAASLEPMDEKWVLSASAMDLGSMYDTPSASMLVTEEVDLLEMI